MDQKKRDRRGVEGACVETHNLMFPPTFGEGRIMYSTWIKISTSHSQNLVSRTITPMGIGHPPWGLHYKIKSPDNAWLSKTLYTAKLWLYDSGFETQYHLKSICPIQIPLASSKACGHHSTPKYTHNPSHIHFPYGCPKRNKRWGPQHIYVLSGLPTDN